MNEIKIAGASYITAFYQEVQFLNHNYAVYINSQLEIAHKCNYEKEKIKNISSVEMQNVNNAMQLMRISVIKTYLAYKTIGKNIKISDNHAIEDAYKEIIEKYNFSHDRLEIYIMEINNLLVSDIIKELIDNSQSLINQIYSNDTSGTVQQ
jgi:hypothetical protein